MNEIGVTKFHSLDQVARDGSRLIEEQAHEAIEDYLKITFSITQRVSVHRPRWMPAFLYTRLMRSILIERGTVKVKM